MSINPTEARQPKATSGPNTADLLKARPAYFNRSISDASAPANLYPSQPTSSRERLPPEDKTGQSIIHPLSNAPRTSADLPSSARSDAHSAKSAPGTSRSAGSVTMAPKTDDPASAPGVRKTSNEQKSQSQKDWQQMSKTVKYAPPPPDPATLISYALCLVS